jgi:lysophospholipase L1-like esterase
MWQRYNRSGNLIISAILFQFILASTQLVLAQDNSQLNISGNRPMISNESLLPLGWRDETGTYMPEYQDYLILGADRRQENNTFHLVIIGDSIAWGTGLEQKEKYYYKVADWLQKTLKRSVEVKVLAHTGATLAKPEEDENTGQKFINPELASWHPTLLEQAGNISAPENVDLILLSGGINDINVNTILNPLTNPEDISTRCANIEAPLVDVLEKLLDKCIKSKIIVTSYYPIISNDTTKAALNTFANEFQNLTPNSIEGYGFNLVKKLFGEERVLLMMSSNSNRFDKQSRLAIDRAIEEANRYSVSHFKEKRVFFAPVDFPSNRSYGTNESWLWELTDPKVNNGKFTDDNTYAYRISLCEKYLCDWNYLIIAIGHPNVEGANEYNKTIIDTLLMDHNLSIYNSVFPQDKLGFPCNATTQRKVIGDFSRLSDLAVAHCKED